MIERTTAVVAFVLTILCGVCVVTFESFHNFLLLLIWLVIWLCAIRDLRHRHQRQRALLVGTVHGLTMAAIITAAALAPGKRLDRLQEQPILIPSSTMTVGQLSEHCKFNRESLPLRIYIPTEGATAASTLHFSSTHITLREFIQQVERQTEWSGRIMGCGNAYTILDGGAYHFGLIFLTTDNSPDAR